VASDQNASFKSQQQYDMPLIHFSMTFYNKLFTIIPGECVAAVYTVSKCYLLSSCSQSESCCLLTLQLLQHCTCITASYTEARPLFKKPLEQQGNMLTKVSMLTQILAQVHHISASHRARMCLELTHTCSAFNCSNNLELTLYYCIFRCVR
jgi:hypothetical protein